MSESRSPASPPTHAAHIIMVVLVIGVLFGNNFLTSSGQGAIERSVAWSPNSLLRSVTELLNLSYQFATPTGAEVKDLIFGVGAALAVLVGVIAFLFGRSSDEGLPTPQAEPPPAPADEPIDPTPEDGNGGAPAPASQTGSWKRIASLNLTKLHGAQVLMGIAVIWSFQSINWSQSAGTYALGGSVVMATTFLWALGLSLGLDRRTVRIATVALIIVSLLTAAMALWYFYVRNPNQRAKYPIGNPLFLTAVLIPATLLVLTAIIHALDRRAALRPAGRAWRIAASLPAITLFTWVFAKAGSPNIGKGGLFRTAIDFVKFGPRATLFGLVFGAVAIVFFTGRRRTKMISGGLMAALLITAIVFVGFFSSMSEYGRGASIRLRQYAWSYAIELVNLRKWTGVGQGGYSLLADERAGNDALIDPEAFQGRVSHAHNEWLETWADLGTLGFVFVIGSFVLTFAAGVDALRVIRNRAERWRLIGLMGALLALMVEECTDVGLRVAGLPAIFFTVLGLVWASISLATRDTEETARIQSVFRGTARGAVLVVALLVSAAALMAHSLNWQAALAQAQAPKTARELDFDSAVHEADFAATWRLSPVRRLEANVGLLRVYAAAAAYRTAQWQDRSQRARAANAPPKIQSEAREDFRKARSDAQQGLVLAHDIRTRISRSAFGAGVVEAGLCGLLATIEAGPNSAEISSDLRRRAIDALTIEVMRHRTDDSIVLQLLAMAPNKPTPEFVDLLIGPLRAAPFTENWEGAALHVISRPDFEPLLAELLKVANKDVDSGTPEKWTNALSPEVLRLAAYQSAARNKFDEAADLAHKAVDGYRQWDNRLEIATVAALVEQSRYLLLGHLDDPARAAAVAKEAMDAVPTIGRADVIEEPILIEQVHENLAAFHEQPAARLIVQLNPGVHPDAVAGLVARAYVGLVHRVLTSLANPPMALVERWLERAMTLAPDDPEPLLVMCRILQVTGRDAELVERLQQLDTLTGDPDVANRIAFSALTIRNSPELRAFLTARGITPPTTSAPTTAPESQPSAPSATQPADASLLELPPPPATGPTSRQ